MPSLSQQATRSHPADPARAIAVREIVHLLSIRAREVAEELFPDGTREYARLRVGSVAGEPGSSLSVFFGGEKPGNWRDFATGERGDILDLVSQVLFDGNKAEAVQWAKRFLGLELADRNQMAVKRKEAQARARTAEKKARRDRRAKREAAYRLWAIEGQPGLAGTPVESYLNRRGIRLDRLTSYGALRYHSDLVISETGEMTPGLVAIVQDQRGQLAGVHRTFLREYTEEAKSAEGATGTISYFDKARDLGKDAKRSLGAIMGAFVSIQKGATGKPVQQSNAVEPVLICEGIEDALTLAMALPDWRILCAVNLANMAAIELPARLCPRILYRDSDNPGSQADAMFTRAIEAHARQVGDVRVGRAPDGAKDANLFLMENA